MQKLFIHAGFPKTGTTSLQACLRENQKVLASQNLLYPDSPNNAHHIASASLVGRTVGWEPTERDDQEWNEFVTEINSLSVENILISSEFFTAANQEMIKRIKSDFSRFAVQIIFTLRPLEAIVPSLYQQSLKKGNSLDYPQWLTRKFLTITGEIRTRPKLINHFDEISKWANIFGSGNISVIIADSSNPSFLFEAFAEILKVEKLILRNSQALNRSLTLRECEILRLINLETVNNWRWSEYNKIVRNGWVKSLSNHPADIAEAKLILPKFLKPVVSDYASHQVRELKNLGIEILGDIEKFAMTTSPSGSQPEISKDQLLVEFETVMSSLRKRRTLERSLAYKLVRKLELIIRNRV